MADKIDEAFAEWAESGAGSYVNAQAAFRAGAERALAEAVKALPPPSPADTTDDWYGAWNACRREARVRLESIVARLGEPEGGGA